jgi:Response regulator receiver domain
MPDLRTLLSLHSLRTPCSAIANVRWRLNFPLASLSRSIWLFCLRRWRALSAPEGFFDASQREGFEVGEKTKQNPADGPNVSLIIVDDNPGRLELLATALEQPGLDIWTATDPEEGLDLIFQRHPQIVLTDLVMPKMGGLELLGARCQLRSGRGTDSHDGSLLAGIRRRRHPKRG